jgi:hypothetical protein
VINYYNENLSISITRPLLAYNSIRCFYLIYKSVRRPFLLDYLLFQNGLWWLLTLWASEPEKIVHEVVIVAQLTLQPVGRHLYLFYLNCG